jgi:uncharacterized protein (TIGR04255 family)
MSAATNLPEYEAPPVAEVVISLQFKPLESLRSSHFGLLWAQLRERGFSISEDHAELMSVPEEFETPRPTAQVGVFVQTFHDAPPLPRVWYLNEPQDELIQVQRDRISVNWRKGASSLPYPRYKHIMKRFREFYETFSTFSASERLGPVQASQCEVTYVNHIEPCEQWRTHRDAERVVTVWSDRYSDRYLDSLEDVGFKARFVMKNEADQSPAGRLHVIFHPAFRAMDGAPIFVLNLIGRGKPTTPDKADVFELFDQEHEWIVRGFTSITTPEMHKFWRRKNG